MFWIAAQWYFFNMFFFGLITETIALIFFKYKTKKRIIFYTSNVFAAGLWMPFGFPFYVLNAFIRLIIRRVKFYERDDLILNTRRTHEFT